MTQGKQPITTVAKQSAETPAKHVNKIQALSLFLEGRRDEITKILPAGMDVEKVIKTAIMAAMENKDIGERCTAISIYRSVVQAALMGLQVGDGNNEGYFIRYGDSCTFRASYLGWSKVARGTEGVDLIRASVVYSGDEFDMSEQPPALSHKPARTSQRGEIEGAVAVAYTIHQAADGMNIHTLYDFTYVDADELLQAKKMADQRRESPAWRSWPNEMRKKVAIRRLCKMLPRNEQMSRLTRIENSADNGIVDVPDPSIPSDMETIVDVRFAGMEDGEATEPEKVDLPEPEVIESSVEEKKPKARQSATSKLKGKMKANNGAPDYNKGSSQRDIDF